MANKINFNFEKLAQKALNEIGTTLVKQGRANMDEVSYGRVYIIRGRRHIASKEGDSANNLTKELRNTIRYEIRGRVMEYGAGDSKVNYAKYLERVRTLNRPNITKSILQSEQYINKTVTELFINSLEVNNV